MRCPQRSGAIPKAQRCAGAAIAIVLRPVGMVAAMTASQRITAWLAVLALVPACASPGSSARSTSDNPDLPAVWAVGPDRLLELDPNAKIAIDTLPMYQGMDRSEGVLAKADADFIAQTSAAFGGREKASQEWARVAMEYYDQDRYAKAMMRLNQGWLQGDTNPDVYYGFAAVYQDHQNYLEAGDFAATSLEMGQDDPIAHGRMCVPRRCSDGSQGERERAPLGCRGQADTRSATASARPGDRVSSAGSLSRIAESA